jgi:hypothetical protein
MRKPYFTNGMTATSIAEALNRSPQVVRGIMYRYKLPKDHADPVGIIHKILDEHRFMHDRHQRPRPRAIAKTVGLRSHTIETVTVPERKKATAPSWSGAESMEFLKGLRKIQKSPLFNKSFGVDTREEISDQVSRMIDEILS